MTTHRRHRRRSVTTLAFDDTVLDARLTTIAKLSRRSSLAQRAVSGHRLHGQLRRARAA